MIRRLTEKEIKMKKMLFLLLSTLMFLGCNDLAISSEAVIMCNQNEEGEEECIAECPDGYYFQEDEDGKFECIECDDENCPSP